MAISKKESTKRVKLNLTGLTPEEKSRAKESAGLIILDGINDFLDNSSSPVNGGAFEPIKVTDGSASLLFESGKMRSDIEFEPLDTDHIEVGIFSDAPELSREKSLGHNTGFKGHPNHRKLKKYKREFIPAPNKRFNNEIMSEVDSAVDEIKEEALAKKKQEDELVQTILTPDDLLSIL